VSTGFASWLCYCSDVAQRKPTKLCTMFDRLLGWYTIYTFSGVLPCNRILPGAKFTLHPSLALFYIGNVTAWHSSSGRQPNFAALSRERDLYSAGRPSCWALAHILVAYVFHVFLTCDRQVLWDTLLIAHLTCLRNSVLVNRSRKLEFLGMCLMTKRVALMSLRPQRQKVSKQICCCLFLCGIFLC